MFVLGPWSSACVYFGGVVCLWGGCLRVNFGVYVYLFVYVYVYVCVCYR